MTKINKEKEALLTQERLKEMLEYNPDTGAFVWTIPRGNNKIKVGDVAGSVNSKGYSVIKYNGKIYLVHRLVWLYIHGYFPDLSIDHINCNKLDNRVANLREASHKENVHNINKRKSCSSKYKGVHWDKNSQMWRARIVINEKPKCLGFYTTEEEAYLVWCSFAKEQHKEFVNFGIGQPEKLIVIQHNQSEGEICQAHLI